MKKLSTLLEKIKSTYLILDYVSLWNRASFSEKIIRPVLYIYIFKKRIKKIIIRAFNNFIFEEVNTSSQQKLVLVLFFPNGGLFLMLDTLMLNNPLRSFIYIIYSKEYSLYSKNSLLYRK